MQAMDMTYRQDILAGRTALVAGATRASARPSPTSWRRWAPGGHNAGPGAGRWHAGRLGARARPTSRASTTWTRRWPTDRLDILFNCAGIIKRGQEHDPDVFQQVLDVNLTGTMRVCAAARPR